MALACPGLQVATPGPCGLCGTAHVSSGNCFPRPAQTAAESTHRPPSLTGPREKSQQAWVWPGQRWGPWGGASQQGRARLPTGQSWGCRAPTQPSPCPEALTPDLPRVLALWAQGSPAAPLGRRGPCDPAWWGQPAPRQELKSGSMLQGQPPAPSRLTASLGKGGSLEAPAPGFTGTKTTHSR